MTSQIGNALQLLGKASDTGLLPSPSAVRARGDRRRRRALVVVSAGAALALSVFVLLAAPYAFDRVDQPIDPAPSPSRPTSTPGTPRTEVEPPLYRIGTGADSFGAEAIAAHDGRFVVVGYSLTSGPPVYWSDDGMDWVVLPPSAEPNTLDANDIIATDEGFLAVGSDSDGPAAWRSADGRTWLESTVDASRAGGTDAMWGITATAMGYYAWGFDRYGTGPGYLWRSVDGRAWQPVADESVFDLPQHEMICTVREVEGGLRATGVVSPPHSGRGHRVTWTSSDGASWVLVEDHGATTTWCSPAAELGHSEARSAAGSVRLYPDGGNVGAGVVEFVPGR